MSMLLALPPPATLSEVVFILVRAGSTLGSLRHFCIGVTVNEQDLLLSWANRFSIGLGGCKTHSPDFTPSTCRSLEGIRRSPLSFYRYKRRILKRTRKLFCGRAAAFCSPDRLLRTFFAPPFVSRRLGHRPGMVSLHIPYSHRPCFRNVQVRCSVCVPPRIHCIASALYFVSSLLQVPLRHRVIATAQEPSVSTSVLLRTCRNRSRTQLQVSGCFPVIPLSTTSPRFPLTNGHPSSLFRFGAHVLSPCPATALGCM